MRRVLAAAAGLAVVTLAVIAGGRVLGPGTTAAPESRLYVAISRSEDEAAAREIEVIDTASGERLLFDVGARITALALSPARHTLYVGVDDGRLLLVDPNSGVTYGEIRTRRVSWIVPLPAGDEVVVIGVEPGVGSSIARVDVASRREVARVEIPGATAGRPAVRARELLVPLVLGTENSLARYDAVTLDRSGVRPLTRVTGRLALGLPQVALAPEGDDVSYLAQWDSSPAGVRLFVGVAAEGAPREILLGVTSPGADRPLRGLLEVQSSLAGGADGALHVCVGNARAAARYVVAGGSRLVGSECGQLVRVADRVYLAQRGSPRVAVIDAADGRILRALPLPGIPVLVAS